MATLRRGEAETAGVFCRRCRGEGAMVVVYDEVCVVVTVRFVATKREGKCQQVKSMKERASVGGSFFCIGGRVAKIGHAHD